MRPLPRLAVVLLFSLSLACGGPAPPPSAETARVENPDLGLALAALPEPFEAVSTTGDSIQLTAPGDNGPGTLEITLGPPSDSGINLVDATKVRQEAFESAPGGQFFGTRTLGGSLGNVFTARGTVVGEDGVEVEQTWAFALHPIERNRMLTITYIYPTGESQERVNQFLYLLGEIEGVAPADETGDTNPTSGPGDD